MSVSSEVKTRSKKKRKELKWRFEGHKFNSCLLRNSKMGLKKGKYLVELLNELLDKIKERNKLIRIADSIEGGWETVVA